VKLVVINYVDK